MTDHAPLRLALRLNAIFSTLSGVVMLGAHAALSSWLGISAALLIAIGIGLLVFAAQLLFTAARRDVTKLRAEALRHSIADIAWVVGSAVVVGMGVLTTVGNLAVAAVAVPVLALGIAQWRSLPERSDAAAAVNA